MSSSGNRYLVRSKEPREPSVPLDGGKSFLMGKRHRNGRLGRQTAGIPDRTRLHCRDKPSLPV